MRKRDLAAAGLLLLMAGIYIGCKYGADSSIDKEEYIIRAKNFVRRINRRDYEDCRLAFDDTLQSTMPTEKLGQTFDPILETLGEFKRFRGTGISKRDSGIYALVKCEYEKGPASFTIIFDEEGAVSGIYVK